MVLSKGEPCRYCSNYHKKGTATEQKLVIFHPRDLQRGDAGAWLKKIQRR